MIYRPRPQPEVDISNDYELKGDKRLTFNGRDSKGSKNEIKKSASTFHLLLYLYIPL